MDDNGIDGMPGYSKPSTYDIEISSPQVASVCSPDPQA